MPSRPRPLVPCNTKHALIYHGQPICPLCAALENLRTATAILDQQTTQIREQEEELKKQHEII